MAKPSAKRVVLSHYPAAYQESVRPNFGATYYLVRRRGQHMYDGEGATPTQAWNDAMTRLGLTGLKEQE